MSVTRHNEIAEGDKGRYIVQYGRMWLLVDGMRFDLGPESDFDYIPLPPDEQTNESARAWAEKYYQPPTETF